MSRQLQRIPPHDDPPLEHMDDCECSLCIPNDEERYGKWVVIEEIGRDHNSHRLCRARCDCGTIKTVLLGNLRLGLSKSCGCARKGINLGAANGIWKGDNVGYSALHNWATSHIPKPQACSNCGQSRRLEIANISQQYKRDTTDWEWLCRRCHMTKDGRMEKIKNLRRQPAGQFKRGTRNEESRNDRSDLPVFR